MFRRPLLLASLMVNALLGLALLFRPSTRHASESSVVPTTPVTSASTPRPSAHSRELSWVATLKAADVPAPVVADTVIADFERRWEKRQRELARDFEAGRITASEYDRATGGHDREREAELRQVLGEAAFVAWQKSNLLRDIASARITLSSAEADRLYGLRRDLEQERRNLEDACRDGVLNIKERDTRISDLEANYQTQFAALLGDARLDQLSSAGDGIPAALRRQLGNTRLSAEEFGELTDLQRADVKLQSSVGVQAGSSPDADVRRAAIDAARDQLFERILGAASFADWQKSSDQRFQTLVQNAGEWNLGLTEIDDIYGLVRDGDRQTLQIQLDALTIERQGQTPDWSDVQTRIAGVQKRSEDTLRMKLGETKAGALIEARLFAIPRN